jgi:hypothetical protein
MLYYNSRHLIGTYHFKVMPDGKMWTENYIFLTTLILTLTLKKKFLTIICIILYLYLSVLKNDLLCDDVVISLCVMLAASFFVLDFHSSCNSVFIYVVVPAVSILNQKTKEQNPSRRPRLNRIVVSTIITKILLVKIHILYILISNLLCISIIEVVLC